MAQRVYSVDEGSDPRVRTEIQAAIARIGGEMIRTDFKDGSEAYNVAKFRSTIIYDGLRRVHIANGAEGSIENIVARMEANSQIKFRRID